MAKLIKTFITFASNANIPPVCFRNWIIEEKEYWPVHPVTGERYITPIDGILEDQKEFLEYLEKMSFEELYCNIVALGKATYWKAINYLIDYTVPVKGEDGVIINTRVNAPDATLRDGLPVYLNVWERYAVEQVVLHKLFEQLETVAPEGQYGIALGLKNEYRAAPFIMTGSYRHLICSGEFNVFTWNHTQEVPVERYDQELLEKCGFTFPAKPEEVAE